MTPPEGSPSPSAAGEALRATLDALGYQKVFNAISAGVEVWPERAFAKNGGHGVSISVERFITALAGPAPTECAATPKAPGPPAVGEAAIPEIIERGRRGEKLSPEEQAVWTGYELGWRDGRNEGRADHQPAKPMVGERDAPHETPEFLLKYAQDLATVAAQKGGCVPEWRPFNDIGGCLTQIDNCLTGLVAAHPMVGDREAVALEAARAYGLSLDASTGAMREAFVEIAVEGATAALSALGLSWGGQEP